MRFVLCFVFVAFVVNVTYGLHEVASLFVFGVCRFFNALMVFISMLVLFHCTLLLLCLHCQCLAVRAHV